MHMPTRSQKRFSLTISLLFFVHCPVRESMSHVVAMTKQTRATAKGSAQQEQMFKLLEERGKNLFP